MRNRDLLESVLKEVAQERFELRCEPIIETGTCDSLVCCCGVGTLKPGDSTGFTIDGEVYDQRPNRHRDVDRAVALDDIALALDVFDEFSRKEGSQSASYE